MSLIPKLQRRFGRLAIPNLTVVLVAGQAAMCVLSMTGRQFNLDRIALYPSKVLEGEVWRLITFVFQPPGASLLVIFYFMLFYIFGRALENQWGEFRYNLFLLVGYLANVGAAFLAYAVAGANDAAPNYFLYGTIFLAFARFFPDFVINLFFVLPIRIKWLALLAWVGYGYALLRGLTSGDWTAALLVVASVANYVLFLGREHLSDVKHVQRRRSFQAKAKKAAAPRHACRVCGLNSADSPKTLFRYCSKCVGQVCYCPEHIRDHEHVREKEPAGRQF